MSDELKPCPFCGGEAKMNRVGNGVYEIVCSNNGCRVQPETPRVGDETEAVKAWNTRAERACRNVGQYIDQTRFKCSDCDFNGWVKWAADGEDKIPNYCPMCGAKVVEE